jgi:hypothetical protein
MVVNLSVRSPKAIDSNGSQKKIQLFNNALCEIDIVRKCPPPKSFL